MNKKEITKTAEKIITLKEIAEITGASYVRNAGWTNDGKRTLLNVEQTTIIIEAMKQSIGQGGKRSLAGKARLTLAMQSINTDKSRALWIDLLHRQIEAETFQDWVYGIIKTLRASLDRSEYEAFRIMDKEHQKEAILLTKYSR